MSGTFLDRLSIHQARAVGLRHSAVVAAAAGSGKTFTMTHAIAADLAAGVPAHALGVATFTRAAASDMSRRLMEVLVDAEVEADLDDAWIGTIDALAWRLVRHVDPRDRRMAEERDLIPLRDTAWQMSVARLSAEQYEHVAAWASPDDPAWPSRLRRLDEHLLQHGRTLPANVSRHPPAAGTNVGRHPPAAGTNVPVPPEGGRHGWQRQARSAAATGSWLTWPKHNLVEEDADWIGAWIRHGHPGTYHTVAQLIGWWRDTYAELRQEAGLVNFLDAQRLAIDACRRGDGPRLRRVYVDESQDTNPLQLALVEALLDRSGTLVLIGDANQSVYGFRGADVESFIRAGRDRQRVVLPENRRSRPEIISFVNEVCGALPALSPHWLQMLPRRESSDAEDATVQWWQLPATTGAGRATSDARALAARIAAEGFAPGETAILCRTNQQARVVTEALRDHDLTVAHHDAAGLLARPEVEPLLAWLWAVADPESRTDALLAVLCSGLAPMRADEVVDLAGSCASATPPVNLWTAVQARWPEWAATHRAHVRLARERGPWPALTRALADHHYAIGWEAVDRSGASAANVDAFCALVARIQHSYDGPSPARVARRLNDEAEHPDIAEPTAGLHHVDAFQVMTVHHAKGLEFPNVIVYGLGQSMSGRGDDVVVDAHGRLGLSWASSPWARSTWAATATDGMRPEHHLPWHDDVMRAARAVDRVADRSERQRLVYVAATRAEERLVWVSSPRDSKDNPMIWLRERLCELGVEWEAGRHHVGGVPLDIVELPAASPGLTEPEWLSEANDLPPLPTPLEVVPASRGRTASAMSAWAWCGLRRHLERLPGEELPTLHVGERTHGRAVHDALARHDNWVDPRTLSRLRPSAAAGGWMPWLDALLGHDVLSHIAAADRVATEVEVHGTIGAELWSARLDLLGVAPDGSWLVVDWKTGPMDAWQERAYAALLLATGRGVTTWWVNPLEDTEPVRWEVDALPALVERIERWCASVDEAPARPAVTIAAPGCQGCPGLVSGCPVSRTDPLGHG